ncbi:hypothetical protein [Marinobacterium jannaschii]|uniref:hypothetical protein n=1 Tax=Marinobacterium jannaschii TaxID=64970 RepID=UPI0004892469|nr:hypothetical protein [Marinobacterium jannaschii]
MKRFYFVSDNLSELEAAERELEASGIPHQQIHHLDAAEIFHEKQQMEHGAMWQQKEVVRGTLRGGLIGLVLSLLLLWLCWWGGAVEQLGWSPFLLIALAVLVFSVWEGSFIGLKRVRTKFNAFLKVVRHGRHAIAVEIYGKQEAVLRRVTRTHAHIYLAGFGAAFNHRTLVPGIREPD